MGARWGALRSPKPLCCLPTGPLGTRSSHWRSSVVPNCCWWLHSRDNEITKIFAKLQKFSSEITKIFVISSFLENTIFPQKSGPTIFLEMHPRMFFWRSDGKSSGRFCARGFFRCCFEFTKIFVNSIRKWRIGEVENGSWQFFFRNFGRDISDAQLVQISAPGSV